MNVQKKQAIISNVYAEQAVLSHGLHKKQCKNTLITIKVFYIDESDLHTQSTLAHFRV